jgi:hypothetical protein
LLQRQGVCIIPNLLWIILLNQADSDFYKLIGHTPWNGMAEHPSKYMAKQSRPESNHQLQEPSHMKSDGVDAWLQHWLKLQKRNKHPLILKDNSDKIPSNPKLLSKQKRKAKASTPQSTDDTTSDEEPTDGANDDDEESADRANNDNEESADEANDDDGEAAEGGNNDYDKSDTDNNGHNTANMLPLSPLSASETRIARREFLATLSEDENYQSLLLMLSAAQVSNMLSSDNYKIYKIFRMVTFGRTIC